MRRRSAVAVSTRTSLQRKLVFPPFLPWDKDRFPLTFRCKKPLVLATNPASCVRRRHDDLSTWRHTADVREEKARYLKRKKKNGRGGIFPVLPPFVFYQSSRSQYCDGDVEKGAVFLWAVWTGYRKHKQMTWSFLAAVRKGLEMPHKSIEGKVEELSYKTTGVTTMMSGRPSRDSQRFNMPNSLAWQCSILHSLTTRVSIWLLVCVGGVGFCGQFVRSD
ncbi:unnamed protein product [Discosporangium mesarthrocarpum]